MENKDSNEYSDEIFEDAKNKYNYEFIIKYPEKLEFEKYALNDVEGNAEGKFTKETQIVIYKYKKLAGRVIAKYIDSEGNTIHEDTVTTGKVDEEYKVDRLQIEGYELKNVIGKEEGTFKLEDQTVTFKYQKIETPSLPQTGQTRIIYAILVAIIVVSIVSLGYLNNSKGKEDK